MQTKLSTTTLLKANRVARLGLTSIFGAALVFLNVHCTSFHGVGDYRPDARSGSSTDSNPEVVSNGTAPSVSWNGERRDVAAASPNFEWPVEDARMSRGFMYGHKAHWGLDLANRKGTPIHSADDGVVIYTGTGFRGYGKLVVVEHNSEWATLYGHLSKINVREGQKVARGEVLGGMGTTGHSSGNHLHFEIRHHRQPVNPLAYLPDSHSVAMSRRDNPSRPN